MALANIVLEFARTENVDMCLIEAVESRPGGPVKISPLLDVCEVLLLIESVAIFDQDRQAVNLHQSENHRQSFEH